jgi:hypothetical protein
VVKVLCPRLRNIEGHSPLGRAAITSIAGRIGCTTAPLRPLVPHGREPASGASRWGMTQAARGKVKELWLANEILRKSSVYFAMVELDRHGR